MTLAHVVLIRFRLDVGLVLPHPAFQHFVEGSCDGAPDRPLSLTSVLLLLLLLFFFIFTDLVSETSRCWNMHCHI
jgi:hypothetical protein